MSESILNPGQPRRRRRSLEERTRPRPEGCRPKGPIGHGCPETEIAARLDARQREAYRRGELRGFKGPE